MSQVNKKVLIIGGGGHAKVLIDALSCLHYNIVGVLDPQLSISQKILAVPVLGGDEVLCHYSSDEVLLVNGIGSIRSTTLRQSVFEKFCAQGYHFETVIHPSAIIGLDVDIGEGTQIMAGVVIQTGGRIGVNSILNTRAVMDHDVHIGNHVHIAPGVTLSGGITIDDGVHIGTGASIIQGIHLGEGCLVAAGAVVTRDVAPKTQVRGVPAKRV
ncbi:acetyltransferase [Deltaproteobacteria bacterium TL4]